MDAENGGQTFATVVTKPCPIGTIESVKPENCPDDNNNQESATLNQVTSENDLRNDLHLPGSSTDNFDGSLFDDSWGLTRTGATSSASNPVINDVSLTADGLLDDSWAQPTAKMAFNHVQDVKPRPHAAQPSCSVSSSEYVPVSSSTPAKRAMTKILYYNKAKDVFRKLENQIKNVGTVNLSCMKKLPTQRQTCPFASTRYCHLVESHKKKKVLIGCCCSQPRVALKSLCEELELYHEKVREEVEKSLVITDNDICFAEDYDSEDCVYDPDEDKEKTKKVAMVTSRKRKSTEARPYPPEDVIDRPRKQKCHTARIDPEDVAIDTEQLPNAFPKLVNVVPPRRQSNDKARLISENAAMVTMEMDNVAMDSEQLPSAGVPELENFDLGIAAEVPDDDPNNDSDVESNVSLDMDESLNIQEFNEDEIFIDEQDALHVETSANEEDSEWEDENDLDDLAEESKAESFKCHLCPKRFNHKLAMLQHMKTLHMRKKQKRCFLCSQIHLKIERHVSTAHEDVFPCIRCLRCFTTEDLYDHHKCRKYHKVSRPRPSNVGVASAERSATKTHKKKASVLDKLKKLQPPKKRGRPPKLQKENEKRESGEVREDKIFYCSDCVGSFKEELHLLQHYRTHHQGFTKDVCIYCESVQVRVNTHVSMVHLNKCWACVSCYHYFNSEEQYSEHECQKEAQRSVVKIHVGRPKKS